MCPDGTSQSVNCTAGTAATQTQINDNIGKSIISKLALTDTLNWQELAPEYRYRDLFIIQNVQSPYPETAAVYDVIKDLLIQLSEEADA